MKTILAAGPRVGSSWLRRCGRAGLEASPVPLQPILRGGGDRGLGPDYGVRVRQYLAAGFPSGVGRSFDAGACLSVSGDGSGFGLGLAIAQRAVAVNGGTISAHNRVPHGVEINVAIPAVLPEPSR